ncbi:TPA: hypothetical protein U6M17_001393 [Klebsiella pneumoniae]|uniref:hypothetical protein n=1 Tax=Klebsiella pneumoniae TaxID=573 RepID=UPI000E2CE144|nr:hypothetical protein [Klebsiella pneumoniae]HCE9037655.1 hypothetical protein [Klebsiella michiganensis]UZW72091.1 hypothetical protein LCN95_09290 [Klebsiella pneumoniae]SYG61049.1 Uncharacterised protein [Klebsiella pneumoniae]HCE9049827.1 hypothetical protein [Klebsiella michiganensis]HEO0780213.1 hypothetical protein [Klebsiella pneumoniae]
MDNIEISDDDLKNHLIKLYLEEKFNKKTDEDSKKIVEKQMEKLRQITPMLFFQFLADRGVSGKCVSCGSEKLSVPQAFSLEGIKAPAIENGNINGDLLRSPPYVQYVSFDDVDQPRGILNSYYQMNCLNCGHLTLYRASVVLKWFARQESKEAEGDE